MQAYLLILVLLYLTPIGGYYLARQCGKEPQQGKKVFEQLHYLLLIGIALWVTYYTHFLVLIFSLILYGPLHWKARAFSAPALIGFLYGIAASDVSLLYPVSVLLLLYGLVEGTLYTLKAKPWKGLLKQHLPFFVLGIITLAFVALWL